MMFKLILLPVFLIAALIGSSKSEHCNEDELRTCLKSLEALLEKQFTTKTEAALNSYCSQVTEEGKCLQEATAACKKEHPLISVTTARLFNYLNLVCRPGTDERTFYMNIVPCFDKEKLAFQKCLPYDDVREEDDVDLENACKEMTNVFCVADVSRQVCGTAGEEFAKNLKYGLHDTYEEVCSTSSAMMSSFWLLMFSIVILLCAQKF